MKTKLSILIRTSYKNVHQDESDIAGVNYRPVSLVVMAQLVFKRFTENVSHQVALKIVHV